MNETLTDDTVSNVREETAAGFSREFRSRNKDILSSEEQAAVDAAKVLVAGCGTVGGSAVEPLARLGVSDFVLADPDVYDASNLNRQACFFADIGRPKPEVLADRVVAINPYAEARTLIKGITPDNVEAAFDGVTFVCEGIDASMDLWAKYLVHRHAALRGIPVVSGVDLGGQPTLYVFDYRSDPRPFYGRGTESDHREGRVIEAIGWLGVRPLPADFAPIIVDRLRTGSPWPQTVYTAWGIGALMTRALVDLALERDVPYVLRVDFHQLVRNRRSRLAEGLRWPVALLRAKREANRVRQAGELVTPSPERASPLPAAVSEELLPLVEAIRLAPSAGNLQPWSIQGEGERVRLLPRSGSRLPAYDPAGALRVQSIGCALEAAASVGEIEVDCEESLYDPEAVGPLVTLRLERIRDDYSQRAGLLALRQTNRRPYDFREPGGELLRDLEDAVRPHGAPFSVAGSRTKVRLLADLAAETRIERLRRARRAGEWPELLDRMPAEAAVPGRGAGRLLMDAAKRSPAFGRALPLERLLAYRTRRLLLQSGALIVLGWGAGPDEWLASGRALMSLWLEATRQRWAVHPVALGEPDADRMPALEEVGISLPVGGITLIRVGRARRTPVVPRIPIERMVV